MDKKDLLVRAADIAYLIRQWNDDDGRSASEDAVLEELWRQFGDVPMDPETECIEEAFLNFPAGTFREDIWHWFDQRHSKGIAHLMYRANNKLCDSDIQWEVIDNIHDNLVLLEDG